MDTDNAFPVPHNSSVSSYGGYTRRSTSLANSVLIRDIEMYREENLLRHLAMRAELLDLNKLWSCKNGRKTRKHWHVCLSVHMIALRTNTVAHATIQWPSHPTKFVEIHNFCYNGSVTSHFSSLLPRRSSSASVNIYPNRYRNTLAFVSVRKKHLTLPVLFHVLFLVKPR